ncbi:transmembrane and coiled-coil domain-containing protein 6 [Drosophila takahashii]|uniref:transmembrane and coiled-coil domain-containing protein 6 n=1 Tax=Drosophila takahashii TaxID=29030 RepID=UPI001CF830C5|nr:transmembrane and coiled-coil domain-containing protein 6 [Drosophila takahashii]
MDTETTPLENIHLRSKIRGYARDQRLECRMKAKDALRIGLGQVKEEVAALESLGTKDVVGMAGRIKRRKHATSEDLCRLSLAFLQGNDNINAFAVIPGAIQVLVKELTGPHIQRHIDAVECLCNLSLGEAHISEKIASLAGSYMVTYLDGKEERLKKACLWTLANILATCEKAGRTLLQMQLVPKLWRLYSDPNGCQEDAGICLFLVATHCLQHVSAEDRRYIAQNLHEKKPEDPASEYFMYIVHQMEIVGQDQELGAPQAECLVHFFEATLASSVGSLSLIYAVRVMANLMAKKEPHLLGLMAEPQILVKTLNQLFALRDPQLSLDLMRLLRNFLQLNLSDSNQLLDTLQIYA